MAIIYTNKEEMEFCDSRQHYMDGSLAMGASGIQNSSRALEVLLSFRYNNERMLFRYKYRYPRKDAPIMMLTSAVAAAPIVSTKRAPAIACLDATTCTLVHSATDTN